MAKTRRQNVAKVRLWRWRSNPLRRRSDRVEAWIVLATWIAALVCGAVAGLLAAGAVDRSIAERRAQSRTVSAVLSEDASKSPPVTADGVAGDRVWATVRWTAPDGSPHTGRTKVDATLEPGARVTVWTGPAGELVGRPPTPAETVLQAIAAGVLAGTAAGATVWGGGRLARLRLDRRRLAAWEAEWRRVGPQWRKRMTG